MHRYLSLALLSVLLASCGPKNQTGTAQDSSVGSKPATPGTAAASGSTIGRISSVEKDVIAKEGSPAPNFTWKDEGGAEHSLAEYRGRVVMVNFWGTWCPPCRAELPDIVRVRDEFNAKGFEVIGIALERNDDLAPLRTFATRNNLRYPIVLADETVPGAYGGISAVPTTFIVDREGRVRSMVMGMQSAAQFRALVSAAM